MPESTYDQAARALGADRTPCSELLSEASTLTLEHHLRKPGPRRAYRIVDIDYGMNFVILGAPNFPQSLSHFAIQNLKSTIE